MRGIDGIEGRGPEGRIEVGLVPRVVPGPDEEGDGLALAHGTVPPGGELQHALHHLKMKKIFFKIKNIYFSIVTPSSGKKIAKGSCT